MHKLFRTSVLLIATASISSFAIPMMAQEGPPPQQDQGRPNQGRGLDMLAQRLSLTDDQKAQLTPIFEERRQKMQALRSSNADPDQRRADMKKIMEESDAKIKPILNADQWQQYQQMQQEMRQRGPRQGPPDRQPQ